MVAGIHSEFSLVLFFFQAEDGIRDFCLSRGLGIINVMTLFGAGSILTQKRIRLNINLETWREDKLYDRVGLSQETLKILDTEITKKTIPVRPGRNVAVIIEVAAMNYRLNIMGINTAEEFNERLNAEIMKNGKGASS
ncbi:hypothetical protein [Streptococcus suis]